MLDWKKGKTEVGDGNVITTPEEQFKMITVTAAIICDNNIGNYQVKSIKLRDKYMRKSIITVLLVVALLIIPGIAMADWQGLEDVWTGEEWNAMEEGKPAFLVEW